MKIRLYNGVQQFMNNLKGKKIVKRTAAFLTASVMLVSTAGCFNDKKNDDSESQNITVTWFGNKKNKSEDADKQKDNSSDKNADKVDINTLEGWKAYEKNLWEDLCKKTGIDISEKDFKTALLILNTDYLNKNNPQLIRDYISETGGINGSELNMDDELRTFYNVLSQIRLYNANVKDSKNYYSLNNLLVDKTQSETLNTIENIAKASIELDKIFENGNATEDDYKKAKILFDYINDFQLGKGKINDISANKLSNGGVFIAEENMKIMSLKLRNYLKYNDKEYIASDDLLKFAKSLNSSRAVSNVQSTWYYLAGQAMGDSDVTDKKQINEIKSMVSDQTKAIYDETKSMGVTNEEINALYTIANIDYFFKNANTNYVFNDIYSEGFDLTETLNLAESAVSKIEMYNLKVNDKKDLYDYSHLFIESIEDIYSVMYVTDEAYKIHTGNKKDALGSAKNLVDYSAYSDDFKIVITKDGKKLSYNKNSLNLGGTQVVNLITYYTFLNNKSKIDNEQLYKDGIKLVDGTTEISDVQSQIVLLTEGKCLKKDSTSQYTMGSKK